VHRHERLRKLLRAAHALGAAGLLALAAALSVTLPARANADPAVLAAIFPDMGALARVSDLPGGTQGQTRTTLFPVSIQTFPSEVSR
jgi:hypothetical protein